MGKFAKYTTGYESIFSGFATAALIDFVDGPPHDSGLLIFTAVSSLMSSSIHNYWKHRRISPQVSPVFIGLMAGHMMDFICHSQNSAHNYGMLAHRIAACILARVACKTLIKYSAYSGLRL